MIEAGMRRSYCPRLMTPAVVGWATLAEEGMGGEKMAPIYGYRLEAKERCMVIVSLLTAALINGLSWISEICRRYVKRSDSARRFVIDAVKT